MAGRSSGIPSGGARLAPFDACPRTDIAKSDGSSGASNAWGGTRSKPVEKKRLIRIFLC